MIYATESNTLAIVSILIVFVVIYMLCAYSGPDPKQQDSRKQKMVPKKTNWDDGVVVQMYVVKSEDGSRIKFGSAKEDLFGKVISISQTEISIQKSGDGVVWKLPLSSYRIYMIEYPYFGARSKVYPEKNSAAVDLIKRYLDEARKSKEHTVVPRKRIVIKFKPRKESAQALREHVLLVESIDAGANFQEDTYVGYKLDNLWARKRGASERICVKYYFAAEVLMIEEDALKSRNEFKEREEQASYNLVKNGLIEVRAQEPDAKKSTNQDLYKEYEDYHGYGSYYAKSEYRAAEDEVGPERLKQMAEAANKAKHRLTEEVPKIEETPKKEEQTKALILYEIEGSEWSD